VEPGFFRTELLVEGASTIWPELDIEDDAELTAQTADADVMASELSYDA
jgi:hypothetical protein